VQQHLDHLFTQKRIFHRPSSIFNSIAIVCLMAIIMSMLAACGDATPPKANSNIVLTEMDYWSVPAQGATLATLFKRYHQLHPNVTIQRNAVPFANLIPKADQEAASHTLPNLLVLDNPNVADFASTGALAPLDTFMQKDFKDSDFYAGPLSTMKYQNKTYAFPVGSNDLALYYDIKAFKAAGLTPPTTWSELMADAKKLTSGNTYGFAFSGLNDEEGTFQFEPYLWSNKGDLSHADSAQSVSALQFLVDMVHNKYASRAVLNWGQNDVATQYGEGHAAMMENGPWEIPTLEQQYHLTYGTDFGIVPLPVPQTGMQPVTPLGGETWTIPVSNPTTEQAAWDLVNWLEQPTQLLELDKGFNYIPAIKSTAQTLLKDSPDLQVFADGLNTAHARTAELGPKYPKVSQALWTAEQSALSGSLSAQSALSQAQQQINTVLSS
jgi:multiple sugar transport system substrate-binding protein